MKAAQPAPQRRRSPPASAGRGLPASAQLLLGLLLAAASEVGVFRGFGPNVAEAQADQERVLLALSSQGFYRDKIAAELRPYSNGTRLPNATSVTVTEASTGQSSLIAPWTGPLVAATERLKLGAFTIDEEKKMVYAVTQDQDDKNRSYLVSQDFVTGEERSRVPLTFSPITSIAYYNGTILTFRQHCDSGTGRQYRWCRAGSGNQSMPRPPGPRPRAETTDGHGGLYSVIANATDGSIIEEHPLPPTALRVLPGLISVDPATRMFYAAVIMSETAPGLYPNDTHIIAIDVSTGLTLDNYTFRFPWRMTSLQTMRYTRSRTQLVPMSSVVTEDFYYEQTVLLGLRIGDEGPEAFSVDPSNGVLCVNPRCIPEDEWLASEDYAQEQIAAANAAAAGGAFVDQWALDRMPIEIASELFLFFSASDGQNKELLNMYRDSSLDKVRRIATMNVANDRRPTMDVPGPEFTENVAGVVIYGAVPRTNLVAVPPLMYHTEPVPFEAYVDYPASLSQNLTAAYGPVSGGTTIQLIGVEFLSTDDLRCKFRDGVVHADYYLKERGVVQCRSPYSFEDYAGPVTLELTMAGVSFMHSALTFTYYSEPEVLLAFPVAGGWDGGTVVRLSGRGIFGTPLTRCRFTLYQSDGLVNETFGMPNATTTGTFFELDGSLRCAAPPLATTGLVFDGTADAPFDGWVFNVQVSLNGQQYAPGGQNFTYFATPLAATEVIPPLGPTTGGTVMTVNGNRFVHTGATNCYVRAEESGQVYDRWVPMAVGETAIVPMDLNNDTQGVCVSGTWEVPEVVEFRISMNRFDVYNDGLIFEYYEPVRLDLIEPSLGPATGVNPDGSGMTVSVTTSAFYPFVNVGGGAWLRCRFGGADGGVTQATFISPESLTCGVPANLASAGAVEIAVSLNGQQYHPSTTISFHYTPVIFTLTPANLSATPPIGPDTGGSLVSVVAFGAVAADSAALSNFVCRFNDIDNPADGLNLDGSVRCIAPPLPDRLRVAPGFHEVVVQLSVDAGVNFSPTTAETDPCACYGSGLAIVPSGATAPDGACVGGEGGGPRCWNATSNVYRYHNLLESLAFVSSGASSAVLDGGGEVHVDGTGIMVTAFPEKLSCRLSFIRSPGALSADRAAAEAIDSIIVTGVLTGDGGLTVSCPVPASSVPRDVEVAVSLNGQQFSGAGPRFNYYDVSTPPRVHRIDPRSGPLVGGTLVTVNGWNVANVPTLTCRWLRNGTSEVLSTVPATFVSTAAATCVAPAVGMAVGSLYAYVQLANSDSGSGYSTEIRNEYTYTTSSPEISTAWGIGTPPGLSGTHVAGAPAQVQARAYDGLGNPQSGGGDAFSVTLTHGGNDEIVFESEQEDLNNGQHIMTYNATVAGSYDVTVSLGGFPVESAADSTLPNHPYSVIVVPDASFGPLAVATGNGVSDWYIWDTSDGMFVIQSRDRYGNDLVVGGDTVTVAFDPPADGPSIVMAGEHVDLGNGTYSVVYATTFAGEYRLNVQVNGADISNSGAALQVHPDVINPVQSYANVSGSLVAGDPLQLAVMAVDQYGNAGRHGGATFTFELTVDAYEHSTPYQNPVTWFTPPTGPNAMTLADNSDGTYAVVFSPTLAGDYSLQVRVCIDELGADILAPPPPGMWASDGCAYLGPNDGWSRGTTNTTLVAAAPYGANTLAYGAAVTSARSGDAFDFEVETRDVYNNRILVGGRTITAALFQTGYNIQTAFAAREAAADPCLATALGECAAIQDTSDGRYTMSYRVTLSGAYKLFIAIEGIDISSEGHAHAQDDGGFSWFTLDVDAADAFAPYCLVAGEHECTPAPQCTGFNTAGLRTELSVNAFDRFGNERTTGGDYLRMRYTPIIDWTGAVDSTIVDVNFPEYQSQVVVDDGGDGDYVVSYSLTKTGDYLVYLEINNMTFPDCPFPFTVGPAEPYPGTSTAAGPAFDGMTAGNLSTFVVTSYDFYHNLVPYGGRTINATTQPLDMFGNEIINFGPEESEGGGGYAALHDFSGGRGFVTPFEVQDALNGEYEMSFTLYVKAGMRISIFMDGTEISGSPYASITTPGPLWVNNSIVVGAAALNGAAGTPAQFHLQSRDEFGNDLDTGGCGGTGRVFAVETMIDNIDTVNMYRRDTTDHFIERAMDMNVTDLYTGAYEIAYNLTVAGQYNVTAHLDGVWLLGVPFILTIVPAEANLQNSYAIGPGVVSSQAGELTSISIVTVDVWTNECIQGGDEIRALIRGPRYPPEIIAADLGTGVYQIDYTLDLIGQYNVIVNLNDYRFALSPLTPYIIPGPAVAEACIATGSATTSIDAGALGEFYIQGRDMNGNSRPAEQDTFAATFSYNQTMSGTPPPPVSIVLSAVDGSTYGNFTVFAPAGEWALEVLLHVEADDSWQPIGGSPFSVTLVEAPLEPQNCTVTGDGATDFTAGDTAFVTITSRDRFGNRKSYTAETAVTFTVAVSGPTATGTGPVETSDVQSLRDGRYQFSWTTLYSGIYTLLADLDGVALQDIPRSVNVAAGPTILSNSVYGGAFTRGEAGLNNSFSILTHDVSGNPRSGPIGREMTVNLLVLGHMKPMMVEDLLNGTVLVTYNETLAGEHTVYIVFGGEQDHSATLVIEPGPLDYEATVATGSGSRGAFAATTTMVVIEPSDRFGNRIDGIDASRFTLAFNVSQSFIDGPNHESAYTWSYLPARFEGVFGSHELAVAIDGVAVNGSPYIVEVIIDATTLLAGVRIPGATSDFDDGSSPGQASRVHFIAGAAVALEVAATDITITEISTYSSTHVTIMYRVTSATDLTAIFSGSGFKATLISGVNGAGSDMAALEASSTELIDAELVATYPTRPASCTAFGEALSGNMLTVGDTSEFTVQYVNQFGISQRASTAETIQIDIVNGTNASVMDSLSIVEGNGLSTVSVVVSTKGVFEAIVKVDNVPIIGSPFSLTVQSGLAIAANTFMTPATGSVLAVVAGETAALIVVPIDTGGNREDYGLDLNSSRVVARYSSSDSSFTPVTVPMQSVPVDMVSEFAGQLREVAAGTYTLEMSLHGQAVAASPFELRVSAAAPVSGNFLTEGDGLAGAEAGEEKTVSITARDEFMNQIAAVGIASGLAFSTEFNPDARPTPGSACDLYSDAACCATQQANLERAEYIAPACHSALTNLLYSVHCAASPAVAVCTGYCAEVATACGVSNCTDVAGLSALAVRATDCVGGVYEYGVAAAPPSLTLVPDSTTGRFEAVYSSETSGAVQLNVTFDGVQLAGAPFLLDVVAAAADPSQFVLFGPGLATAVAGITSELSVLGRDRFGNAVAVGSLMHTSGGAFLEGPRLVSVAWACEDLATTCVATYTCTTVGAYMLNIDMTGGLFRSSNVSVSVGAPSPDISMATVLTRTVTAGEFGTVLLLKKDGFGNAIINSNPCGGWAFSSLPLDLGFVLAASTDRADGCVATCNGTVSGDYLVNVTLHNDATLQNDTLADMPLDITVAPATTADGQITALGTPGPAGPYVVAGASSYFTIQGTDRFGNLAAYNPFSTDLGFGAWFEERNGQVTQPTRTINNLDNSFTIFFTLTNAGATYVRVEYPTGSGVLTTETRSTTDPRTFYVTPAAAHAPNCLANLPLGNLTLVVGNSTDFSVAAHDEYSNLISGGGSRLVVTMRLQSDLGGSNILSFGATDTTDGTYASNYSSTLSGVYNLFLVLDNLAVQNSPLVVQVYARRADPMRSQPIGFGMSGGYADTSITFELRARDSYGNIALADAAAFAFGYVAEVEVSSTSDWGRVKRRMVEAAVTAVVVQTTFNATSGQIATSEAGSEAETSLCATVTYTVPEPGFYEVLLVYNGTEIVGSPLHITVLASNWSSLANASHSRLLGEAVSSIVAGEQGEFLVELRNSYNVPQPVGMDLGDEVIATFIPLNAPPNAEPVQAEVHGICCDDNTLVASATDYSGCVDARNFLTANAIDCDTDLGSSSPFRFLRDPCPALCGTCVRNCNSTALVYYSVTIAGTYILQLEVNGDFMASLPPVEVYPAEVNPAASTITCEQSSIVAGGAYTSRLHTRDRFNTTRPYTSEDLIVSAEAELIIIIPEFGQGTQPEPVILPLEVVNEGFGVTRLSTNPIVSGGYRVKVYFDGSSTPALLGPDLVVHAAAPAMGQCEFSCESTVVAGELPVVVQAVDQYGNRHAQGGYDTFHCLAYEGSDPAAIAAALPSASNGDGTYTSPLLLTTVGRYGVLCFYDDLPLSSIPLYATITPGPVSTEQTIVIGDGLTRARAGVEKVITVVTRDEYSNEVTTGSNVFMGTLRGIGLPQVGLGFLRTESGRYAASYTATASGLYSISIARGGGSSVMGSPWNNLVVIPDIIDPPSCTFEPTSQTTVTGLFSIDESAATAVAGSNFTFAISTRDVYGNTLVGGDFIYSWISVAGSFSQTDGWMTDNHDGTYNVPYNVYAVGEYLVSIVVSAVDIAGSPLPLHVTGAPIVPEQSVVSGVLVVSGGATVDAGAANVMVLECVDQYNNPSSNLDGATIVIVANPSPEGADVVAYLNAGNEMSTPGRFEATVTLRLASEHSVRVYTTNPTATFAGSPFSVDVIPAAIAAAYTQLGGSTALTEAGYVEAGVETQYTLVPYDAYSNSITNSSVWFDEDPSARALSNAFTLDCRQLTWRGPLLSTTPCDAAAVQRGGDGAWSVAVTSNGASTENIYRLDIFVLGTDVFNSPLEFYVEPGPLDGPSCTFEGQGTIGGVNARYTSFTITARDQYGNARSAQGLAFESRLVRVVTDAVIYPSIVYDPAQGNRGSNDPNDNLRNPQYDHTENQLLAFFRFGAGGEYTLQVTFDGSTEHITGSPLTLTVSDTEGATDPPSTVAQQARTACTACADTMGLYGAVAGSTASFNVRARQAGGMDKSTGGDTVTVMWRRSVDGAWQDEAPGPSLTVTDTNEGLYLVEYTTDLAAQYQANVAINGVLISTSPSQLEIVAGPLSEAHIQYVIEAGACKAGATCDVLAVGKDRLNNVRTGDPLLGADVIRATALRDNTVGTAVYLISVVTAVDGGCRIRFEPTRTGNYTVSVVWRMANNQVLEHQSSQPLYVDAGRTVTQRSTASGGGFVGPIVAGDPHRFTIHAKDAHDNHATQGGDVFLASISSSASSPTDPAVTDNSDGSYGVAYQSTVAGTHTIVVMRSGFDIDGSPAEVAVVAAVADATNCVVDGAGIARTTPAVSSIFRVAIFDTYGNPRLRLAAASDNITAIATLTPTNPAEGPSEVARAVVYQDAGTGAGAATFEAMYMLSTYALAITGGSALTLQVLVNGVYTVPTPYNPTVILADPPIATTAQFTQLVNSIEVTFDRPTDRANTATAVECATFFDATIALTFGDGSRCLWQNDVMLLIILGTDATCLVGDELALADGRIRAVLRNSRFATGSVMLLAPPTAVRPTITIAAPATTSSCDGTTLDASATGGGAGRVIAFQWGVQPNIENYENISALLQAALGEESVTMPPGFLVGGMTYTFHCRATNFMGESDLREINLRVSTLPVPQLIIGDGSETMYVQRSMATSLSARVKLSACISKDWESLGYDWVMESGIVFPLDERTKYGQALMIPKNTLVAGSTYSFSLLAWPLVNVTRKVYASLTVVCAYSPVTAHISGGDRTVSRRSVIELDASESIDPDKLPIAFGYTWACQRTPLPAVDALGNVAEADGPWADCFSDIDGLLVSNTPKLMLSRGLLEEGVHVFTVTVAKEKGVGQVQASTTSVRLTVLEQSVPSVAITANCGMIKISPTSKIVLYSSVDEALTLAQMQAGAKHDLRWRSTYGGFNESDPSLRMTALDSKVLVFAPRALSPGQTYRFELSAPSLAAGGGIGLASVELSINLAPSGGKFMVEPLFGNYTTKFNLRASGWLDEDVPLQYEYRRHAHTATGVNMIPIGSFAMSSNNQIFAYLPESSGLDNYTTMLTVRIYDAYAAFAENFQKVSVPPVVTTADDFLRDGARMLERSVNSGDLAAVMGLTDTMSKKMNEKPAGGTARRALQTTDMIAERYQACTRLDDTLSKVPVTQSSCSSFASSLRDTVDNPLEMNMDSTEYCTNLIAQTLLRECLVVGFAGYEGQTDVAMVTAFSALLSARDVSGTAREQNRAYAVTDNVHEAVYSISESTLQTKEIGETDSVVDSENIVVVSRKVETSALGGTSVAVPAKSNARFELPDSIMNIHRYSVEAVNVRLLYWAKDPYIESRDSSRRLSSVLELSLFDAGAASGRRRQQSGSVTELSVNNLEECINVTIPMDAAAYEENADYNATCVTWGEDDWTMGGCTTRAAYADHIECCCVHLSTFGALLFNTAQLEVDELALVQRLFTSVFADSRPEPLFVLTGVLLLYFAAVAFGHRKDQLLKDRSKYEEFKIEETQDLFSQYKKHLEAKADLGKGLRPSTPSEIVIRTPTPGAKLMLPPIVPGRPRPRIEAPLTPVGVALPPPRPARVGSLSPGRATDTVQVIGVGTSPGEIGDELNHSSTMSPMSVADTSFAGIPGSGDATPVRAPKSIVDTLVGGSAGSAAQRSRSRASTPGSAVKTPKRKTGKGLRKMAPVAHGVLMSGGRRVRIKGLDTEAIEQIAVEEKQAAAEFRRPAAAWLGNEDSGATLPPRDYDTNDDSMPIPESDDEDEDGAARPPELAAGPAEDGLSAAVKLEAKVDTGKNPEFVEYKEEGGPRCVTPSACVAFWTALSRWHLVASICAGQVHGRFTRPQRATVVATCSLLELAAAAIMVRHLDCSQTSTLVVAAMGSAAVITPLLHAISRLFLITSQKYHEASDALKAEVEERRERMKDHDGFAMDQTIESGSLAKVLQKLDGRLLAGYYGWRLAHHSTYFCCLTLSVFATAEVVFYGMKFDLEQVSCWGIAAGVCAGSDQLVYQPLVAVMIQTCCVKKVKQRRVLELVALNKGHH